MELVYSFISEDPRYEYKHKHYLKNQDKRVEQARLYRQEYREEIRQKRKERVRCEICDIELSRASLHHHNMSKRHLKSESLRGKIF